MEKAPAIAYLRSDVSGARQYRDGCHLRRLSERLGYSLRETLVLCAATHSRIERLLGLIAIERAEAVFVPHVDHLDGELMRVVLEADVIVDAHEVYARWPCITSSNGIPSPLTEQYGDHHRPVRREIGQEVRSIGSERRQAPKAGPDNVHSHLRILPSPNYGPQQPGTGEMDDWLLDR